MDLQQRSFSSHLLRPKPQISFERTSQTLILATAWGDSDVANQVIETISEHLALVSHDDATVVRSPMGGLSETSNRLLTAARIAQEKIYLQLNRQEYSVAVELALVTVVRNKLSWVQIGSPSLLLSTAKGVQPLCHSPDWSEQFGQSAPLVGAAMGINREAHFQCGSYLVKQNEKLILLSKSYVPSALYKLKQVDMSSVAQCLVDENPEHPFWLGMIDLINY